MFKIHNESDAVKYLQLAKNYFDDASDDAGRPATVTSFFLEMIDEVQLFLQPGLNFDKLQKELSSKK